MREVNAAGRALVAAFEGTRLERYKDGAGYDTIGIGHKILSNDDIGQSITPEQCQALFEADLAHAARAVDNAVKKPLNDNQFAALVDFTFNLGAGALGRSTLLTKLNAGDFDGAAEEFQKWVYCGPEVSEGLVRRRDAEKALFFSNVSTT